MMTQLLRTIHRSRCEQLLSVSPGRRKQASIRLWILLIDWIMTLLLSLLNLFFSQHHRSSAILFQYMRGLTTRALMCTFWFHWTISLPASLLIFEEARISKNSQNVELLLQAIFSLLPVFVSTRTHSSPSLYVSYIVITFKSQSSAWVWKPKQDTWWFSEGFSRSLKNSFCSGLFSGCRKCH